MAAVEVDEAKGGSWDERKPSSMKTFKALFKRTTLLKLRDIGTIITEIIASIIFIIFGVLYEISFSDVPAVDDAPMIHEQEALFNMTYLYNALNVMGNGISLAAIPDDDVTKAAISDFFSFQNHPVFSVEAELVDMSKLFRFYSSIDDVKEYFSDSTAEGVGFSYSKVNENWFHDVEVTAFQQPHTFLFYSNMALLGTNYILKENGRALAEVYNKAKEEMGASAPDFGFSDGFDGFALPEIYMKVYAKPVIETAYPINTVAIFLAVAPIIIASMPDLNIVLNDKETHMMTFIYLMGGTETIYWLVTYLHSFISCFIPYIVVTILFVLWCGLQGTNYVLLLIIVILFIISYLCFQYFISTFFQSPSAGRVVTVVFLIAMLFFGYMNQVYLIEGNDAIKHVLSLFPMESFELVLYVLYEEVRTKRGGVGFGDFTKDFSYPIWAYFVWQIVDIILWGGLFIFCNATVERDFGAAPLKLRDIFTCNIKKKKKLRLENIDNGESIMKIEGLTKRYKGSQTNAVNDLSFDIKKGEIIVMIGPNGAGKSTIINTLSGAIPATKGTLALGSNEPTHQFTGIQNCLGIVFQDNVIMRVLSIREHLELFGHIRGIEEETLQNSIDYFADMLQLTEMLPNRAGDLSGGQKRKLCIALALLGNPPIIIMDEPTAGVDVQARQLIWKSISGLKNSTCIITTHALEEAEAVSSRLFVIAEGKMPFAGTSTELRNTFKCGYLLKLDCEPEKMPEILKQVQKTIPDASLVPERDDSINIPVVKEIPQMLQELYENKEQLGVNEYSFTVEQLEDVLSRMLNNNQFVIPSN